MAQNKHLTLEERTIIANMLSLDCSLTQIAAVLNRDVSTIRLEIKKHRRLSRFVSSGRTLNNCRFRNGCDYRGQCVGCSKGTKDNPCRKCSRCNDLCSHYEAEFCSHRDRKPYCCNGCSQLQKCRLLKYFYKADEAHREYRYTLSDSREGLNITPQEVKQMEPMINRLIREQKQSVHSVVRNNPDLFSICEKTLYNYIDEGIFETRNIDLPKKVRFMPRKSGPHHKVDRNCTVGRKYSDFLLYIQNNPGTDVVEIDSVEGPKGTPVLLTLYFRSCGLQLAFIREMNNSASVIDIFNHLYTLLGHDDFTTLFPVVLADNGSEFSNPEAIENHITVDEVSGELSKTRRTTVFYCDPGAPYQKGACERNHEFIRYFVPKGHSFSDYSQDDISLMMNHINSYTRSEKKNPKSPASRFIFNYGEAIAKKLGIIMISQNEVSLSRSIFKK